MTQIQTQIARLQVMANDLLTLLPSSKNAQTLAESTVPNIEALRAMAKKEIDEGGLSSETYDAISSAMGRGEGAAWGIIFDEASTKSEQSASKLLARQFDNTHIMMSALGGLPVPEGLKCWPPEDPNCP